MLTCGLFVFADASKAGSSVDMQVLAALGHGGVLIDYWAVS